MKSSIISKVNLWLTIGLVFSALTLQSCGREQELFFDKPANERALDLLEKTEKTLLANKNGWEMVYEVPNKDVGGAFRIQLQFSENKTVTTWADFLDEPTVSSYALSLYNGPTLTFDTPGALTELADPSVQPRPEFIPKDGYFGENDFVIISATPEKVQLRGLKYGNRIDLTPLSEPANLTNEGLTKTLNQAVRMMTRFGSARVLVVNGEERNKITFSIPPLDYFISSTFNDAKFSMILEPMSEEEEPIEYEVIPNEKGITLQPALLVDGVSHTNFLFDAEKKAFVAEDNSNIYINLQSVSELTQKLLPGGEYFGKVFFTHAMSPAFERFASKEKLEEVFPGFITLQWYNFPDIKALSFLHNPGSGNNWQDIGVDLVVIDDSKGIYQLKFNGQLSGEELTNALTSGDTNAVIFIVLFFTSLGNSNIIIEDVDPSNKVIRLTSVDQPILWIEFQRAA